MTKDEAIHKALKVLNCLNNDRVYETAWVKGAINTCEEALEQPAWQGLTDDEKDNFIVMAIEIEFGVEAQELVCAIEAKLKEKNHGS